MLSHCRRGLFRRLVICIVLREAQSWGYKAHAPSFAILIKPISLRPMFLMQYFQTNELIFSLAIQIYYFKLYFKINIKLFNFIYIYFTFYLQIPKHSLTLHRRTNQKHYETTHHNPAPRTIPIQRRSRESRRYQG